MQKEHAKRLYDVAVKQFNVNMDNYVSAAAAMSDANLLKFILVLRDEARVGPIEDLSYAMDVGKWLNSQYEALSVKLGRRFNKLMDGLTREEENNPSQKQQALVGGRYMTLRVDPQTGTVEKLDAIRRKF